MKSSAEGEKLAVEQFKEVEQKFCKAIGLANHREVLAGMDFHNPKVSRVR